MKSLYESILDDEDILIGSVDDKLVGQLIYHKLINHKKLTKDELKWTKEKVSVFEVDKKQLKHLTGELKINNISLNWLDVSKLDDLGYIFFNSNFNGDISKWDVSNVKEMRSMFAYSLFNGDISKWDVSNVKNMHGLFYESDFNGDISKWDVSKVTNMSYMFAYSKFNKDISKWEMSKKCDLFNTFLRCPIKNEYKPEKLQDK